ncbi:hypothetical protein [Pengzhenrongella sp.]|uniref:hypothetical protein n=1 Tax=Pengzhenrongella sp. TaxID=2888820 RepID=UPI002F94F3C1
MTDDEPVPVLAEVELLESDPEVVVEPALESELVELELVELLVPLEVELVEVPPESDVVALVAVSDGVEEVVAEVPVEVVSVWSALAACSTNNPKPARVATPTPPIAIRIRLVSGLRARRLMFMGPSVE